MGYKDFKANRERLNNLILNRGNLITKRFFSLDTTVYHDNALSRKTKELIGLVASVVLRCNDCILYHLDKCIEFDYSNQEIYEALDVALVIGGSITIPHIRYAYDMIDEIRNKSKTE